MHDVGLAAWFGGSLMGAVVLNGATAEARDPKERVRLSSIGWARWTPVELVAIVVHGVGGLGLIWGNKGRLAGQKEGRTNTNVKLAVTAAAVGASLYAGAVGRKMSEHADEGVSGVTEPSASSSSELRSAQRQQKVLQWAIPVLTFVLVVLAAQQGEQQRPVAGWLKKH